MAKNKKPEAVNIEEQPTVPETKVTVTEGSAPLITDIKKPGSTSTPSSEPAVVKSDAMAKRQPWPVWLWVTIGVAGLGGLAALGYFLMGFSNSSNSSQSRTLNTNTGEQLASRQLDGVLVPVNAKNPNIYAVMIENISESRPPSGLDKASLVYEALAEGGITRFMALFPVSQNIKEIGPIRSARQYFIEWAEEYKPLYVHVGGSPESLRYLQARNTNVVDFNQFRHSPNFIRDKTRQAPHNLYTSTDLLYLGLKRLAPDLVPSYTPWSFKDETPLDSRPAAVTDIVIDFSSFNYKVTYKYDRALNHYERYQGEAPHLTRDNDKIFIKNIVVQFTKTRATGDADKRLDIETVGEGKMLMFRDGAVAEGTWKKDSVTARTRWTDTNGQPLALNRGTTWIEIIPTDRKVLY